MPEAVDQPAPPLRTWRPMVLWTAGILLALGLVWFVGAVVVMPRVLLPRNETSIVDALRAYREAQVMYRRADGAGMVSFADELPKLRGLLPDEVIAAWGPDGRPYRGYLFRELKTLDGQPVARFTDFGICAIPVKYGVTGRRSFVLSTGGWVFSLDWGKQVGFLDDFPAGGLWVIEE